MSNSPHVSSVVLLVYIQRFLMMYINKYNVVCYELKKKDLPECLPFKNKHWLQSEPLYIGVVYP